MKPTLFGALLTACLLASQTSAAETDSEKVKAGLRELNEFIGGWKGNGQPVKQKPASSELWSENIDWSWRFKGDDTWLSVKFEKGRHFKSGDVRYLPAKKLYQFTVTDAKDAKRVFEGELKDGYLVLERTDPDTKELQRITMNTAAEGVRFIYRYDRKPEGGSIFLKDYMVASTKLGESLGTSEKKNECVVSGGLGTMTVSYKGETFYVCCSGCRDAFNEKPEKYIAEFKARKAGKKP